MTGTNVEESTQSASHSELNAGYLAKIAEELQLVDEVELSNTNLNQCEQFLPKYLFEKLLSQACRPDAEHLRVCECSKKYLPKAQEQALSQSMKEYDNANMKERDEDGAILKRYKEFATEERAYDIVANYCKSKDIQCEVERKEIFKTLVLFAKKYDFNDPRVFVIIDSLLHQMLSAHRMQMYSNRHGILQVWYDKMQNKRISLSPVEMMKLKYDEARIDAIATLDKIMEGNKNINLTYSIEATHLSKIFDYNKEDSNEQKAKYKEI
jgi:hypothetical protein